MVRPQVLAAPGERLREVPFAELDLAPLDFQPAEVVARARHRGVIGAEQVEPQVELARPFFELQRFLGDLFARILKTPVQPRPVKWMRADSRNGASSTQRRLNGLLTESGG